MHPFSAEDFTEAWQLTTDMVPVLKGAQLTTKFNGMFAFSIDGYPIMGESQVPGFWVAVASWISHAGGVGKSMAEWMTYGETAYDMRQTSIDRFVPHTLTQKYITTVTEKMYREVYDIVHPRQPPSEPRNVRLTPFYSRHQALGCSFTAFAGFELPLSLIHI